MRVSGWLRVGLIGLLVAMPLGGAAQQGISLENVAAAADPAVGRVLSVYPDDNFGTGSGFVLGAGRRPGSLFFLTNQHVVRGATEVVVGFQGNGVVFVYDASVATQSDRFDLAVLELVPVGDVSQHEVRPLGIRPDLARKGESVVALGFPGAADTLGITIKDADFFSSTLTDGTVSKTTRASWRENTPQSERFDIVQHTASINPGNSGGPLLDTCANMVGLNTAVAAALEDGFQPNDTYWATSSPVIAGFLRQEGIAFTDGATCSSGPVAAAPIEPPAPSVAERAFRMPTWAVALISLGLAAAVIGGIVAVMLQRSKSGAAASVPAASGGGVALTLQFGGGAREEVGRKALEQGIRIGRGPEADIRIDAAGVSRLHALLRLEGRRLMLTDLGSTNQTKVDGRPLVPNLPVRVTSSSRIVLGGETLSLSQGSARRGGA